MCSSLADSTKTEQWLNQSSAKEQSRTLLPAALVLDLLDKISYMKCGYDVQHE